MQKIKVAVYGLLFSSLLVQASFAEVSVSPPAKALQSIPAAEAAKLNEGNALYLWLLTASYYFYAGIFITSPSCENVAPAECGFIPYYGLNTASGYFNYYGIETLKTAGIDLVRIGVIGAIVWKWGVVRGFLSKITSGSIRNYIFLGAVGIAGTVIAMEVGDAIENLRHLPEAEQKAILSEIANEIAMLKGEVTQSDLQKVREAYPEAARLEETLNIQM